MLSLDIRREGLFSNKSKRKNRIRKIRKRNLAGGKRIFANTAKQDLLLSSEGKLPARRRILKKEGLQKRGKGNRHLIV